MCLFIINVLDVTMFCCICNCNGNKLFRNVTDYNLYCFICHNEALL